MQKKPALNHQAILAIDTVVREVERHYQQPMDLELVYNPTLKTIYVVQARPIVHSSKIAHPSYLASSFAHPIFAKASPGRPELVEGKSENYIPCTTICTGNNNVQKIISKQTIILAQTLNQALDRYNTMGPEKQKIQAVVIERNGQTTSHAAAIFRGEGILVVQTNNLQTLNSWLNKQTLHIYLDPQRQLIVQADTQTNLEIKSGFINHPIAAQVSLDESLGHITLSASIKTPPSSSYQELL